jgi:hypothetical protein
VEHAPRVWALPFSLATTQGIIIIFFSSRYLDVSVLGVGSRLECYTFSITGCPIRRSRDITLVCNSPWLIAAYHVLLRLSDPRHPPCALIRFKKFPFCGVQAAHHKSYSVLITTFYFPICQRTFALPPQKRNHAVG